MKAVWSTAAGHAIVERAVPTPGARELLVKVQYAALNPKGPPSVSSATDAARTLRCRSTLCAVSTPRRLTQQPGYANVEGNDVVGVVEAAGEGVTSFAVGQRVGAFTRMRTDPRFGGFAEYCVRVISLPS